LETPGEALLQAGSARGQQPQAKELGAQLFKLNRFKEKPRHCRFFSFKTLDEEIFGSCFIFFF